MITAHDLTKRFGDITALDSISFSIEPGEFVFLTGTSGSGKTTLLRMILRELKPDSGSLTVAGVELGKLPGSKLPAYRQTLGPIFQDFKLLPDRSVWENVALPLQVKSVKSQAISQAVKLALEMVGLENRAGLFPSQLSGGELQRIAIARSIAAKPQVILADEPTGNLDPKTARSIVKLLRDVHSELKTTVLMATHNADIVNHYNLRVITLEAGKLIKDASHSKYD